MHLLTKPIITNKTTSTNKLRSIYTFLVNPKVNKIEIKKSIQTHYNVSVKNIRTIVYAPKTMRRNVKSGIIWGKSNKTKKVLIELQEGKSIDFCENT